MIKLYNDDCFNIFPQLEDKSIDLVLCDPPYGTTACKWDTVLDLEKMWKELKRITKDRAAIVLTARQPFTSVLICSNLKMFKYCWIWEKENGTNFFAAKFQPLDNIEDIVVFSRGGINNGCLMPMNYNPQGIVEVNRTKNNGNNVGGQVGKYKHNRMVANKVYNQQYTNYPFKTIRIKRDLKAKHPTQKPVALMKYLIKTYSNEGDTVLDFCMGSGTTGVACKNLNRNFIGVELLKEYYDIAVSRINDAE